MKSDAASPVWFKHLRNIGSTVGRNNRRPKDEREAFLGHAVAGGMSKFYTDDAPDNYLVRLVNLIGAEYFGGEKVGR